jgi:hypothetical protein
MTTEVCEIPAVNELREAPPRGHAPERLLIIATTSNGQLANRLLLFSHLVALAHERGHLLVHPAFGEYADLFESTKGSLFCRYPATDKFLDAPSAQALTDLFFTVDAEARAAVPEASPRALDGMTSAEWRMRFLHFALQMSATLDARPLELSSPLRHMRVPTPSELWFDGLDLASGLKAFSLLFLDGWGFRAVGAHTRNGDAIRRFFVPAQPYRGRVESLAAAARAGCDRLIGIHIRLGDYMYFEGGKYFFPPPVYVRIMQEIRALLAPQRVRFVVCSNETHSRETFGNLDVVFGSGVGIEDLYLLAGTDAVFGPKSTYSYWASFYGDIPLQWLDSAYWSPTPELMCKLKLIF